MATISEGYLNRIDPPRPAVAVVVIDWNTTGKGWQAWGPREKGTPFVAETYHTIVSVVEDHYRGHILKLLYTKMAVWQLRVQGIETLGD